MNTVIFDPRKEQPPRDGAVAFDKVSLNPGTNSLTDEQLRTLKGHPDLPSYEQTGAVTFPEAKSSAPKKTSLKAETK
ncbi:MAG: hypothetical protein AAFX78_01995 [Cyanobacteria bacterium J06638_20]